MRELPVLPPIEAACDAVLLRLPLLPDVIGAIQRRAARNGHPHDALSLAHELGDVRFVHAYAPKDGGRPRWQGGLSVFNLLSEPSPALIGYSTRTLPELQAVPPPQSWPADPIDWSRAEAAPLLSRLARGAGCAVPFAADIWPNLRVVDPAKPPSGTRRIPRMRDLDIARHIQATQPDLGRAEAYATWLARNIVGAEINIGSVRIGGEATQTITGRSFRNISLRLVGRLSIADPELLTRSLLRGVGRRRAYGLGLLVAGV